MTEMVIERCVFCGRVIPKGQRRCRCEEDGKSDNVDAFEGTTNPSTARKGRAKCPRFRDRNDYQGVSRIGCNKLNIRFASQRLRDAHYRRCCCRSYEKCQYFGIVTKEKW